MKDWEREWKARMASLFETWSLCEDNGPETCALLMEQIRACRALAYSAPLPEREMAGQLLDEAWEAAHRLLYGDLDRAREHVARARSLRSRIGAPPPGAED